jgi:hypothetical protein
VASTIDVGNLIVRIIADAKQLEAGLAQAGSDLNKFDQQSKQAMSNASKAADSAGTAMTRLIGRLGAAVAAYVSVNTAVQAFNNAVENVTALDNLSQATGVSIERLSELRNVALATGTDFEVLSQAASQFGARMTQGLASSTSQASQAIRALGIDIRDGNGNLRSFDDVLSQVAARFPEFANGTNKAALAAAIFGEEAGPKLVRLLNQGSAGLEKLKQQFGSTVSADDAERVRQYKEVVAGLQIAFEKLVIAVLRWAPTESVAGQSVGDLSARSEELGLKLVDVTTKIAALNAEMEKAGGATAGQAQRFTQLQNQAKELEARLAQVNAALTAAQSVEQHPPAQAPAMDPFALERAQLALQQLQDRLLGTRDIFDEINFSWQKHAEVVTAAIEKINQANDQSFRRDAALAQLRRQMRLAEQSAILEVASTAAQTITALWPKQKGAAIAAAVINTAVGITRALATLPPPYSWAQAALIAASGAAQIATINSMNEKGGSAAAPTPTTDPNAGSDQVSQSRSLTISGIDPNAIFSGQQVENLIHNINAAVKDGVTLISTRNLPL